MNGVDKVSISIAKTSRTPKQFQLFGQAADGKSPMTPKQVADAIFNLKQERKRLLAQLRTRRRSAAAK